jgi:uncharacterized LabA/DUF88 family protein
MRTYAFIDAANLFYGGEKSLGWKIDYRKLRRYLRRKYGVEKAFYFAGVELYGFPYDYQNESTVSVARLEAYLHRLVETNRSRLEGEELSLLVRNFKRTRFYMHLQKFGFTLCLKPVKSYRRHDGSTERKANCDVDMTFYLMKEIQDFDRAVILSGDGDFLLVLKYLRESGKEIAVLSRAGRTAREIREFAGTKFRDFEYLREIIQVR